MQCIVNIIHPFSKKWRRRRSVIAFHVSVRIKYWGFLFLFIYGYSMVKFSILKFQLCIDYSQILSPAWCFLWASDSPKDFNTLISRCLEFCILKTKSYFVSTSANPTSHTSPYLKARHHLLSFQQQNTGIMVDTYLCLYLKSNPSLSPIESSFKNQNLTTYHYIHHYFLSPI